MEKIGPMSPDEIQDRTKEDVPEEIFQVFNQHIIKNWRQSEAVIEQKALIKDISKLLKLSKDQIFKQNLLDVEDFYREAGWHVEYEKPAYGDNDFEPYFKFKKKNK